jgi:two-component system, NarL family, sensor histidine kinase UhpB
MRHAYSYFVLLSFLILVGSVAVAQVPKSLDSLETYVKGHTSIDTNYVQGVISLAYELNTKKAAYQRADSLLQIAEKVSIQLDYGRGLARTYNNMGNTCYLTNRPKEALLLFQKALKIGEKYKLHPRTIALTLSNIAIAYSKLGQPDKVVEIELQSLQLQKQYNLKPLPSSYENIGHALKQMLKPNEAIGYYQQALAIKKAANNLYGMAITQHNIGRCYDDLNQEKEAIAHYKTALSYIPGTDYELLKADILNNIGIVLRKAKRFKEAKSYLDQGMVIAIKQNNTESISFGYFNLGRFYEEVKDYKQAERNMKKALTMATERDDKASIANFTQGLADLYGGMKDFQQAYVFQLERNQRMDSTTAIRTSTQVQQMVAKYEAEKKEAHIKLLQQEAKFSQQEAERTRFRTNALLTVGVLLLLLGAAVSAWLLNRSKLRRLQEAQTLRKRIAQDLHDEVGSTLSSISLLSGHTDKLLSDNRPGVDASETAQKMVQKIYTDAQSTPATTRCNALCCACRSTPSR